MSGRSWRTHFFPIIRMSNRVTANARDRDFIAFKEQSSDPRFHFVPSHLVSSVKRQVLRQQWARAYKRHVAAQYVPQSGEFVQAG